MRDSRTFGRKAVATRDLGFARLPTVQGKTFEIELVPCSTVDGTINSTTTQQRAIGRVDDTVHFQASYIAPKRMIDYTWMQKVPPVRDLAVDFGISGVDSLS